MATIRAFGLGLVAAVAMLAGCADASAEPATAADEVADVHGSNVTAFKPESVNADQRFADSAVVTAGSVTVPTAGNEAVLAKIKVGSIVAANRSKAPVADGATNPNPYGFLAKVNAIKTDGPNTVLTTEQALLTDWIQDGDIDFTDPKSIIDGTTAPIDASNLQVQTLHILDHDKNGSGTGSKITHSDTDLKDPDVEIIIDKTTVRFHSSFEGGAHIHTKSAWGHDIMTTGADVKAVATFEPEITATFQVKAAHDFMLKGIKGETPAVVVPIEAGPVPLTLSFAIGYECGVSASGEIVTTATATLGLHTQVGFEASAGLTDRPYVKNLSKAPTLTHDVRFDGVTTHQSVSAVCTAFAKVELRIFDAVGVGGKFGPQLALTAEACKNGVAVYEQHGFAGSIDVNARFPWVHWLQAEKTLVDITTELSDKHYIFNSAKTCDDVKDVDSCADKKDGFYCSEILDYAGYYCSGGQIDKGRQCDMDQKCMGGDDDHIECK